MALQMSSQVAKFVKNFSLLLHVPPYSAFSDSGIILFSFCLTMWNCMSEECDQIIVYPPLHAISY